MDTDRVFFFGSVKKGVGPKPKMCKLGEIIESFGGLCHLSTILLKNFHLFKIAESVINLCLKIFSN